MVFGSCRSHRRGPTVRIQTPAAPERDGGHIRKPDHRHIPGDRARWLALRKRRQRGHCWARCPRRDWRLGVLVAAARPTLARRCNSEVRAFCGWSSAVSPRARRISFCAGIGSSSKAGIRGARSGMPLGGRRNERRRRRGLVQLHRLVMIREQRGFGRDRADADIAIRRRLERRPIGRDRRHGFGDRGKSSAIDLLGTHRRGTMVSNAPLPACARARQSAGCRRANARSIRQGGFPARRIQLPAKAG